MFKEINMPTVLNTLNTLRQKSFPTHLQSVLGVVAQSELFFPPRPLVVRNLQQKQGV